MKLFKVTLLLILLLAGTQTIWSQEKKQITATVIYKYSELRTWKYALPNGIRLVIRPDDSAALIHIRAISPGGALLFQKADYAAAMHAGEMVASAVTAKLTGTQITFMPEITAQFSMLTMSCKQEELERALQVIAKCFTAQQKDIGAFKSYLGKLKTAAQKRQNDPEAMIEDQFNLLSGYPDGNSAKAVGDIDPQEAYSIFTTAFGNAANFSFVLTGKLKESSAMNTSKLLPLISNYLGMLPSGKDISKELDLPGFHTDNLTAEGTAVLIQKAPQLPSGEVVKTMHSGNGEDAFVKLVYHGNYKYHDSVDLQLKVIRSLLEKQLKKNGVLKNLKVSLVTAKYPRENYQFDIGFTCPAKIYKSSIQYVQDQVKLMPQSVDAEALKNYIASQKLLLKKQYFDNDFWTDFFIEKISKAEDPYDLAHYPYNFRKATPVTVGLVAEEFLNGRNYIQLVVLP